MPLCIRHTTRQQHYQLTILCPTFSLRAARRDVRSAAQGHGLRVAKWDEIPVIAQYANGETSDTWRVIAEFHARSDASMRFLQTVIQRLGSLPLSHIRLDILPSHTTAAVTHEAPL